MNVGSLFSGIGGLDLGLERAGHRIVFQCERDEYRRRVLARHWPGVPCFHDVREVGADWRERAWSSDGREPHAGRDGFAGDPELICGGFPCQDLSVAGRRRGLAGDRSGLFFEFARIADAVLPAGGWVLIENVPGLLSSHGGRDFAVLLATLAELGFHDLAWRVLDSRYLGVPQRRRRVFILARRSRGRRASEVLLEPESGGGDFEASREARQAVAGSVEEGISGPLGMGQQGGFRTTDLDSHGAYISSSPHPNGVRAPSGVPGRMDGGDLVAPSLHGFEHGTNGQLDKAVRGLMVDALPHVQPSDSCSFDPKPDSPRYAACGDAVTVNVAEWIGRCLREFA